MKRIIQVCNADSISASEVKPHSLIGIKDEDGDKFFLVQTGEGLFHAINNAGNGYFNRFDNDAQKASYYIIRYESFLFDDAEELFNWLLD